MVAGSCSETFTSSMPPWRNENTSGTPESSLRTPLSRSILNILPRRSVTIIEVSDKKSMPQGWNKVLPMRSICGSAWLCVTNATDEIKQRVRAVISLRNLVLRLECSYKLHSTLRHTSLRPFYHPMPKRINDPSIINGHTLA